MPVVPRRIAAIFLSSLAAVLCVGVAGCGGGGHPSRPVLLKTLTAPGGQRSYKVRLPNGRVVVQAHSPTLAEPPKGLQLTRPALGVATVEQFDSVTVSMIPRSARYVAGYVNGHYANYRQMLGRWPVVVGISVSSDFRTTGGADCFDMEPGNPPPSAAAPWATFQFAAGNARPCEYSMLSWMPAIRANLAANGIPVCTSTSVSHCVRLWDANWTYSQHLDLGYACTQFTDHAQGRNLDESSCARWFYSAPKPPPPPNPVCYSHRLPEAKCAAVRAQVAGYRRASAASLRAFEGRGCVELRLRERWFADHVNRPPASRRAYRQAALAATRRVERGLACGVFAQRVNYFDRLALQTRAAN